MPSSLLVRVVFALLVAATTGAFFITQRLKRAPPPVERVFFKQVISPNGDGRKDRVRIRFELPEAESVVASIIRPDGGEVRRLVDGDRPAGRVAATWDGRTGAGRRAPDGEYRLRIVLRSRGRSLTSPRPLTVDTVPPRPQMVAVTPSRIVPAPPPGSGVPARRTRVRIRYRGPSDPAPLFTVFRTDRGAPRAATRFRGPRFRRTAAWDGRLANGRPAADGTYAVAVTVQDEAGNAGSAPASLPPARGSTRPRTGVTVDRLSLAGPLEPVAAGSVARFAAGPVPRRLRWRLARLGSRRALARGDARGGPFAVRVPGAARTGLHLLRVSAPGGRAVHPVAVRRAGGRRAARRALVVLPAIAWQGRNRYDEDRDGFPDTLDDAPKVTLDRPLAGRLPAGFAAGSGPLVRVLDRRRARYELTTDLALARGRGPRLGGRRGVLFAGDERWLPPALLRGAARYAAGGGRVASFGADAFRRRVAVGAGRLSGPTPPAPADAFGERAALRSGAPAPLVVFSDRIGLFAGSGGALRPFGRLEESAALGPGARPLAAAGHHPERAAFVAYRLRRGLVIRAGAPGFAARALRDREAARIVERAWTLLSR